MSQNLLAEAQWLRDNPHFSERPASIREFMGPDYLGLVDTIRPGVLEVLVEIFGEEVDPQWISVRRKAALTGSIGWGKDLLLSEKVLTPRGWVKNEDLSVGDQVIGSDGYPTRIVSTVDVPDTQQYRIHFKDRSWVDCGADHLWEVWFKSTGGRSRDKVICAENLYLEQEKRGHLRQGNGPSAGYKYYIPLVEPVHFSQEDAIPCDAYTVGAFIANGSTTTGIPRLTTHDQDRDEILDLINVYGCRVSLENRPTNADRMIFATPGSGYTEGSNPLAARLREAGIWGIRTLDKRIPERYLRAPVEDRLALLRGLMDGDGHFQKSNNSAIYSTSSSDLVEDLMDLVRGLGGYCTVTEFDRDDDPAHHTEYHVMVNLGDVCPFSLSRKAMAWKPRTNQKPRRSITRVEKLGHGAGRCISVDAPDHLFVTKDYILTHNSTAASIILTYCVHWVQCLKDPQGFFGLMPGTRIAFMMMSTSERQAREVLFGDVKARVNYSPWFQRFCKFDPQFKNQLRFPRDIWIVPGGSEETRFEGYNILAGIIDEADSHKQTDLKDYAEQGLDTILNRITSRFPDYESETHRGLIVVIGQMKSATGFMHRIYGQWRKDADAATRRVMLWESLGWHKFTENPADIAGGRETAPRKSFVYDVEHKRIIPTAEARSAGIDFHTPDSGYIEVPTAYLTDFRRDPVKALKDLAGIPPEASDPFIALPDRILACQDHWHARFGDDPRVGDEPTWPKLRMPRATDGIKRVVHLDLAVSGQGDALGLAMGHVAGIVDVDGEEKPLIVFDLLMRIHAPSGGEIILGDVRRIIYRLARDLGYPIKLVTADGFSSVDTLQQMRKAKINADYLSVDKTKQPYEDLREAIYDERVLFPKYLSRIREGDTEPINIAYRELSQISDVGMKIDHPTPGSKDVADAMAGVVHLLMTQIQYRRGALHVPHPAPDREAPLASQVQGEHLGSAETIAQTIMGGRDAPSAWAGGDPTAASPSFEDWLTRYSGQQQGTSGPPLVELPRRTD